MNEENRWKDEWKVEKYITGGKSVSLCSAHLIFHKKCSGIEIGSPWRKAGDRLRYFMANNESC
jgi:hypothetical protein